MLSLLSLSLLESESVCGSLGRDAASSYFSFCFSWFLWEKNWKVWQRSFAAGGGRSDMDIPIQQDCTMHGGLGLGKVI